MKFIDIASRIDTVFAQCLKKQGYTGIIRYIDASWGMSAKCINDREAQQIQAAGLDILLVFESCGGAIAEGCDRTGIAYFTRNQGVYDAQLAFATAHDVLAYPEGLPVFFAVDYDTSARDIPQMVEYWNGVHDVLVNRYPIGIYGSYSVCRYARDNWPAISYYWQTTAWSGGLWLSEAHIKQIENGVSVCGHRVDIDESIIRGWHMANEVVTRQEFEDYKTALQKQLDENYAPLNHTHPTVSHSHPASTTIGEANT